VAEDTQAVANDQPEATEATQDVGTDSQPAEQKTEATVGNLPDWAQSIIKELRQENAKHRTANKTAENEAKRAEELRLVEQGKVQEAYEQVRSELDAAKQAAADAETRRIKAVIAHRHNLPEVLLDRLKGETEEDMEADALALLEALPAAEPPKPAVSGNDAIAGTGGTEPTGGLSDADIRRMAATYGVSFEALKSQFE